MFAAAPNQSALSHLTLNTLGETGENYQGNIQKITLILTNESSSWETPMHYPKTRSVLAVIRIPLCEGSQVILSPKARFNMTRRRNEVGSKLAT